MPRDRGYSRGEAPRGSRPHLDVTLKPGCRLDPARGELVSADGRAVGATKSLPRGSKVVPVVPQLMDADPAKLSAPERDLARRVKILLPRSADAAEILRLVKRWRCVEHAALGPEISLP